jgi:DNA-binding HxlR family transcriptional regulator
MPPVHMPRKPRTNRHVAHEPIVVTYLRRWPFGQIHERDFPKLSRELNAGSATWVENQLREAQRRGLVERRWPFYRVNE